MEKFLNFKRWSATLSGELFGALEEYPHEEKCAYILEIAQKLISKGTASDLNYAKTLLTYATQHYFEQGAIQYKAAVYYALGGLYEKAEDYIKAYTCYEKYALNNSENDGVHALLLKALILRDNFGYSDLLEKELRLSLGEIDLGLKNDRLYENLGRYIVALRENDTATAKKCAQRLKGIAKTSDLIIPDLVFGKDKIEDKLNIPQKVREYILEIKS